ncbi:hypothetical protein J2Z69_002224 [Paenibacillus shirakamiensis]|uniref:Exosporium leader peptide n=1 Tax=Paenibacillus shirakamiensis TaxID=1265935 RepID=A0ABS4JJ85_9BACL|nr:hypothetical protein [Paenibacillus shirakamiensis]MBP2001181.1 hypothetical protein [Paenibacillus shirakamiensis]
MATIIDRGSSVASTGTQTLSIPILGTANPTTLATFGLFTVTGGSALLSTTVGFQTTAGVPSVIFTILRDGQPIFNVGASGLSLLAITPINITFLDNAPAGYHAYSLVVANNSLNILLNTASVTGPVSFDGISIG